MTKSDLLLVDDSPHIHKMVRACLEQDAVTVHSVYDGRDALAQAAELKPSLILMDMDMPHVNGLEACRQLKAGPTTLQTPVIFFTSDAELANKIKALDMGAIDYILKPVKPEELRARVRAALRARKRLEQTSMVDLLSGLWNKNYLNVNLPVQLAYADRLKQPLSCTIAQIDSLEKIRAARGLEISERVIKSVADILISQSRLEDMLCHLGNGRFVTLHLGTRRSGAACQAGRICSEIERELFYFDQIQTAVTCSFGVTDLPADSLLEGAENCLYRAQAAGGNTVMVAASEQFHEEISREQGAEDVANIVNS
jgi:two-component system cell cycle response regulator